VENVCEHGTGRVVWTVHRPKRGWYLRVRAPAFPPGAHVALRAPPRGDPGSADGALVFGCRTHAPPRASDTPGPHSYPPTPGALDGTSTLSSSRVQLAQTPSTTALAAASSTTLVSSPSEPAPTSASSQITEFLLAPHTALSGAPAPSAGLLARALATLRTRQPAPTYSFQLSPRASAPSAPPLLAFHDHTGAFAVASTTGVLELDTALAQALGVHPSFWVAIALAYLEFLEDREVSLGLFLARVINLTTHTGLHRCRRRMIEFVLHRVVDMHIEFGQRDPFMRV
jgi:hypothetical protein